MDKLGEIVSKSSPLLGTVLNGLLPASGLIISGLNAIFGANPNQPDDLLSKIQQDSEAALKLKQFEIEHQNDLAKIIATDRASAREREVEVTRTTGNSDWIMHFLAVGSFLGTGAYLLLTIFLQKGWSETVWHDLLNFLMLVFSFYFGGMYKQVGTKVNNENSNHNIVLPPPAQTQYPK